MKQKKTNPWHYRSFIYGTVKREFQLRYQGALLGVLWTVLQPLMMIIIYTVLFSQLLHARLPGLDSSFSYGIFICSGMLMWVFFSEMVTRSSHIFIENANLIKKAHFPKICLPLIAVLSASVHFCIVFCLFLFYLLITHHWPGIVILGVFPILLLEMVFALGIGLFLGTLNVFIRDTHHLTALGLQLWFWSTPIVYPLSVLPEWAHRLMAYNPLSAIITSYQTIFVKQQWPSWSSLIFPFILTGSVMVLSLLFFHKRSPDMVDEL